MMKRSLSLISETRLWAAIEFIDPVIKDKDGNDSLKTHVIYKIRMDTSRVDDTNQITDRIPRPGPRGNPPLDLKYIQFGFIHIQDLIERAIIEFHTKVKSKLPGMWMKQFPYPCYIRDRFIIAISRTFPLLMTLAWVYTAAMLIRNIVYEKEQRLKEMMRMMGLGNGVHWTGWFISSAIVLIVVALFLTGILKYGKILEFSDPIIIFLFLLCYAVSTITFSFLISTWFNKANLAAAAGAIIFFVSYLPYPLLARWSDIFTREQKIGMAFLSNVAFGLGTGYFAQFEEIGIGVHWYNIATLNSYLQTNFTILDAMIMLLLNSIIHLLLTFYIEAIWPGEYGIPERWYFCVTRSYWFGTRPVKLFATPVEEPVEYLDELDDAESVFEQEPTQLRLGVCIKNLSKTYPNGKIAVNNLSLNFYENQITSFLGHNGAGKTTTISILTGMFSPTSGTAYIYGMDIRTGIRKIRTNLGICPQYNILFNFLTVEEHLQFYAGLKSVDYKAKKEEITQMIYDLGLANKRQTLAKSLSGGMQRKLSISIAFIGGSRTVILDEPTAGIDPYSRRSIWELLTKYKPGKTIILTTHYMDEADLLGDRIAIIANGKLCCCGSSLFLKSHFGEGYYLTVVKQHEASEIQKRAVTSEQDLSKQMHKEVITEDSDLTKFIKLYIPDAKLVDDVGFESTYVLPSKNKDNSLEILLRNLDMQMDALKLSSYGISDTTLEEIFLKVASTADTPEQKKKKFKPWQLLTKWFVWRKTSIISTHSQDAEMREIKIEVSKERNTGILLLFSQCYALMMKRFLIRLRNVKGLFTEVILPALFVCLALVFTLIIPLMGPRPPLELSPWLFPPPNYIFYSIADSKDSDSTLYETKLIQKPYLGTRCVLNLVESTEICSLGSESALNLNKESKLKRKYLEPCDCTVGTQICGTDLMPEPPMIRIATGDYLVNLTGRNISNWLIKSETKYVKQRYGGFTFGAKNYLAKNNLTLLIGWLEDLIEVDQNDTDSHLSFKKIFQELKDVVKDEESFNNIKIWFNNQGWTSSVAYLNAINNVLLRAHLPQDEDPSLYGITVINHPIIMTVMEIIDDTIRQSSVALLQAICIIFALSFVPASFVLYLIDERITKFKHLQYVSGVKRWVYWVLNYMCDLINYTITIVLCILIFVAFGEEAFVSKTNFFPLCCLLFLYGWACIPLMYPVSFVINIPSAAFIALGCANLFLGIITTVSTFSLEIMNDKELEEVASIMRKIFLFFPHYCLGRGLIDLSMNQLVKETLGKTGYHMGKDPFEWNFLGRKLAILTIQGLCCFSFTLILEYNIFNKCKRCCWKPTTEHFTVFDDDDDVAKERQKVLSGDVANSVIRAENLTKIYRIRKCHFRKKSTVVQLIVVRSLCFQVPAGECFGLLGVNGAGKTSTFQMLTGETSITRGNAILCGYSVLTEINKVQQNIGYCPQFDALHNLLTVREHLRVFAYLRGIPFFQVTQTVNNSIEKLGLKQYSDKLSRTLSGGNKRKLSTAIALIGEPQIIFLDEPTTGMDPKSRRFLWDCILTLTKEGKCIVLTSHSMEECEALCTRLAIMVNGQFKCLGSIQHLKNKFGSGYLVSARIDVNVSSVDRFIEYFQSEFPNAELNEVHHNLVQFQIPLEGLQLYRLFNQMEYFRSIFGIEDYSISQTTLDQVFVNFAKYQMESVDESRKSSNVLEKKNIRSRTSKDDQNTSISQNVLHSEGESLTTSGSDTYEH